jgi:hypothetical protein
MNQKHVPVDWHMICEELLASVKIFQTERIVGLLLLRGKGRNLKPYCIKQVLNASWNKPQIK